MDYIILYNPLSKGGGKIKNTTKLKQRLEKQNYSVEVGSLIDIIDVKQYLKELNPKTKIVIIGGDGTLHYLANKLIGYEVVNEIFVLQKAGTGNDFLRSLNSKEELVKINKYINDIPYDVVLEDDNQKRYFLNSVGMGVDAYIAHLVNTQEKGKGRWSYFKCAYKGFTKYQTYDLTLNIDGTETFLKKTWLAVVANSEYLGKGMKISPNSVRLDDKLEVVVVHGLARFFLVLVFPVIYLGWHVYLKRWVKVYQGQEITLKSNEDRHVQYDGETEYPRRIIKVSRK